MQDIVILNVNNISGIDFAFHAEDTQTSEYSCVSIQHCYITQYRFIDRVSRILEIIERNDHKAFLSQTPNFCNCYNYNYCQDIWQGITIIKRQLNRILCKNKADAGLACITEKSKVISFLKIVQHYTKKRSEGAIKHIHSSKTRVP